MTEQLLYSSQIGAGIKEMCREGVSKRVRLKPRALVDLVEESLYRILDGANRDALSATAEKESGAITGLADAPQQLVALRLVISESELCVVAEGNDALFPALPSHLHLLRQ